LELRGRHREEDSGRDHADLPENDQDLPIEVARMKASIEELVLSPYLFELGGILRTQVRFLKPLKVLPVPEKQPECTKGQSKYPHYDGR
jgi:hypothetical protein